MSDASDPHLEVLQNIWGEMKTLNARINTTNERLDKTNERLDKTNQSLDDGFAAVTSRIDQTNARLDSLEVRVEGVDRRLEVMDERAELHGRGISKLVVEVSKLNARFDNFLGGAHGAEHDDIRARVERLEKHTGLR